MESAAEASPADFHLQVLLPSKIHHCQDGMGIFVHKPNGFLLAATFFLQCLHTESVTRWGEQRWIMVLYGVTGPTGVQR